MTHTFTATVKPMTDRQREYLNDLIGKINSEAVQKALKADLNTLHNARLLDTREASRQIDRVRAIVTAQQVAVGEALAAAAGATVSTVVMPAPAPARRSYPVVPAGRYAVNVDGALRFYNVTVENGRVSAKRYSSDTLVKISGGEQYRALLLMEADPEVARMTYAREKRRCWTCGRKLTDKDSRERGQGKDCAGL